ncbi:post-GPI attachment to proteins factor 6 isoform X5 [Physeter macrocephalus]|uniref:Post-GPI attachment to proteins factor 6 isoform X5 n=1 Tax=Physeter macrocephalus TaxID=9755 RepID=A0A455AV67_PHYMC|nr:post-GPI attachment to proteins factor 6 isoform X5 [Physeter catodon]|eukprot:XP_028340064.1 post-GPI attachment to proteins factor 6 isoform X5 [Physeter catodon]
MRRAGTGTGGAAVAVAVAVPLLLLLAWSPPAAAAGDGKKSDARLVSEQFSQAPQKLAFYSWYGSARLFHFRVPTDTVLLRWLLQVSRGSGPTCTNVEITVYFRYGAPPVINPLGTSFPDNTSVQPSFLLKMLHSNASVNISHPAPGDWFVAAHLPPSSHKIEVKGFVPTCAYIFQPDMLVVRVVEVSILEPDVPLPQTLLSHPSYLKVFVPEYTQELRLELQGCASNGSLGCPVHLTVGSATLPGNFQKVLTCSGPTQACRLLLPSPPWDRWLQVTAKSLAGPRVSVAFSAVAALTACRPWSVNFQHLLQSSPNQSSNASTGLPPPTPSYQDLDRRSSMVGGPFCLRSFPVLREDVDVVSVRFQPLDRVSVLVQSDMPSVMRLNLNTGMDSGGSLTISMRVNKTAIANTSVVACVTAASPLLSFNASLSCTTAFFQGHPLSLSASSPTANLIIPYPETDNWYLSLQLMCPERPEECEQASVLVETTLYLVPCLNDCGPYGQCLLLRRHGYLYAGCSCKAGWRGWSCTDNSTAQMAAQQKAAALLLTLSNLMFLAPIAISVHRSLLVEASVYAYTMFFSTFYHACDQPGEAVLCILNYDTLQYCDFLGSGVSIWVTVLCMARLKAALKYVYRCGRRRHCYPPSWQRWVFYLLPGISMAAVAITIYTSMMTSDNYYYTHSIWHMLLAGSAAFLLPPREQHTKPWPCSQKLTCHYEICKNHRDELYTVT